MGLMDDGFFCTYDPLWGPEEDHPIPQDAADEFGPEGADKKEVL